MLARQVSITIKTPSQEMTPTLSTYLDLSRFLASFVVVISHISAEFVSSGVTSYPIHLGTECVGLFFVLSGFVIAYVCDGRETNPRTYAINRLSRVYSVVVPCLVLTVILDFVGRYAYPAYYAGSWPPLGSTLREIGTSLFSLSFLNAAHGMRIVPGSNGPFWSLSYEVPYYIIFGVAYFCRSSFKWVIVAVLLALYGLKIALLFPLWLLGIAVYRACKALSLGEREGRILCALSVLTWIGSEALRTYLGVGMRVWDNSLHQSWQFYTAGVCFAGTVLGARFASLPLERIARPVRWIAGSTFTVYLLHYPLLRILDAFTPSGFTAWNRWVYLLGVTTAVCMIAASFTERKKGSWRHFFDWLIPSN